MMKGSEIRRFVTNGNHTYSVREVDDKDYGVVYKIYALPDEDSGMPIAPQFIYTVYRYSNLDAFIQNIYDSHVMDNI